MIFDIDLSPFWLKQTRMTEIARFHQFFIIHILKLRELPPIITTDYKEYRYRHPKGYRSISRSVITERERERERERDRDRVPVNLQVLR